jgi:DNA-directed RNA polymerase specialized sigma24 family protein
VSDEVLKRSNLPDDYRKVSSPSWPRDFLQEIADKLGIPVGTVMSRLWRAADAPE